MRNVWPVFANDKFLARASRTGLLLLTVASAFTMPQAVMFLFAAAWALVYVATSKKALPTKNARTLP
jgi:hypothetical protein